jgi:hypothetical protein
MLETNGAVLIHNTAMDSIIGLGAFIAIGGVIGLIASIGLFFKKKWAFFTFYIYALIIWILSLGRISGISQNWFGLALITLGVIYLLFQQKKIFAPELDEEVSSSVSPLA